MMEGINGNIYLTGKLDRSEVLEMKLKFSKIKAETETEDSSGIDVTSMNCAGEKDGSMTVAEKDI